MIYRIREKLWDEPDLISEFISSERDLHKRTRNPNVSEKEKSAKLYAVKGIKTPITEAMCRQLPVMLETVLLTFGDKIIYDSFMMSVPIQFGSRAVNIFDDEYTKIEREHGIFTELKE